MDRSASNILWFDEIGIEDINLVGGKNASLGEMYRHLKEKKVRVPPGFAVTSSAYKAVLENSGAFQSLKSILASLDHKNPKNLAATGKKARDVILHSEFPRELEEEILQAYHRLSKKCKQKSAVVAVRSSATAEDLPTASFAGQQETFLNISGDQELLQACRRCFASLYTNRAIAYRCEQKIDHLSTSLSIGVQYLIRSDLASAGVIFTLDTESGFPDVVYITGSYGLGESVVQGTVNPDEFYVFKPALKKGYRPIIDKVRGDKASKVVCAKNKKDPIKTTKTSLIEQKKYCISDQDILQLAKWAVEIRGPLFSKKWKMDSNGYRVGKRRPYRPTVYCAGKT